MPMPLQEVPVSERIPVAVSGGIADVRLNRPDKHNGLDRAMFEGLVAAGLELADRRDVRAVVLSGEGPSFSAGLDFPAFMADPEASSRLLERGDDSPANLAQRAAWVWTEVPVPVIVALHGAVFGGGLQIALACDLRYAAADARLSVMEVRYGLIPDMSITQTLLRLVRPDVARELTWTARRVEAEEAHALGLVTRVVADPRAEARAMAERIAEMSPHAVRAVKALYRRAPDLDAAEALALETELQLPLLGSAHQLEAVSAVLGKRTARFADV